MNILCNVCMFTLILQLCRYIYKCLSRNAQFPMPWPRSRRLGNSPMAYRRPSRDPGCARRMTGRRTFGTSVAELGIHGEIQAESSESGELGESGGWPVNLASEKVPFSEPVATQWCVVYTYTSQSCSVCHDVWLAATTQKQRIRHLGFSTLHA